MVDAWAMHLSAAAKKFITAPSTNPAIKELAQLILDDLEEIEVPYWNGKMRTSGIVVVHRLMKEDVTASFLALTQARFPITRVAPAALYDFNDEILMEKGITSCFNFRTVANTNRLSNHSLGLSIDINPDIRNPYVVGNTIYPPGGAYNTEVPGTIRQTEVYILKQHGFSWGGDWPDRNGQIYKDYQHFDWLSETKLHALADASRKTDARLGQLILKLRAEGLLSK